MADDARTNSGSIPDPIPEVRDEGPGGTDLTSSSDDADGGGTEASRKARRGTCPTPCGTGPQRVRVPGN